MINIDFTSFLFKNRKKISVCLRVLIYVKQFSLVVFI